MPDQPGTKVPGNSMKAVARTAEHEQRFFVRMLQKHFRPGMTWLDAGCGHTLIPEWLRGAKELEKEFTTGAKMIVGADIDPVSLDAPSPIRRIACNLNELAFTERIFDLISCNMVIEHVAEPIKVFSEFHRVLKPGGIVIMLTPNLYHWANVVSWCTPFWFHRSVSKRFFKREPEDVFPTLYRCNTESAMKRLLGKAGFSTVTVHMVPGRPRLMDYSLLFYPEYFHYRLSLALPQLREILCTIAHRQPE